MMGSRHMLTTIDNPYDPYTQFDAWYQYDTSAGHHSLSLLARVVRSSHDLSDSQQEEDIEQAIEEIVRENVSGVHRKVSEQEER